MPSLTIGAVPDPDAAMAAQFFRDWFGEEDKLYAVLTQILPGAYTRGRIQHTHQPPSVFREAFENADINDLIYAQDERWNLYMGVGVMNSVPVRAQGPSGGGGRGRRGGAKGGKKDVVYVPGVWIDLDADKNECFRDEEHALSLLRSVKPWPTIVVATGTGGVHGYWKTERPLAAKDAENLAEMWWAHLSAEAGVKIDKLTNCDRIMKLPGSIRWEKNPGDQPSLVRLIHSTGARVTTRSLEEAAGAAWSDYKSRVERRRTEVGVKRAEALRVIGDSRWATMLSVVGLEDEFNATHTWHEILVPQGWTDIGTDGAGRTMWARPGLTSTELAKSAATDYGDSQVMSLFSDSPATKLWPLHEANVPLTKYRVFIQTVWDGDEAGYISSVLGG